ncbi:hypothetical protein CEP52_000671 [Fusarium oligoseptatum]|uniref:RING-type E3 ubiquitin transferase n=1 Tax=Fusarium oligoseptatum TaxID=2604345 RepID=A0A428UMZ3_9HYPO|nr:hypothetical protein CEP52_000671 [Fusarium oligoseptatum]
MSSSESSSPYPFATAPDIIRAHQKDAYFTGHLTQIISDLHRRLRGARLTHARAPELQTAAALTYFALTTIPGNRTLGEEYCDLVQIDGRDGKLPSIDRRAGYVVASILLPSFTTGAPFQAVILALFYFSGTYYQLSKRLLSLRYVFTRTVPDTPDRAGYELLGVLLVVQLTVQTYMHIRSTLSDSAIAARERAAFPSDEISLNHDGAYNGDNNLLLSQGAQGPKSKVDIAAATHTPLATVPRIQLTNDKAMGYIKGGQQRKCTLCLEEMRDPSATHPGTAHTTIARNVNKSDRFM